MLTNFFIFCKQNDIMYGEKPYWWYAFSAAKQFWISLLWGFFFSGVFLTTVSPTVIRQFDLVHFVKKKKLFGYSW